MLNHYPRPSRRRPARQRSASAGTLGILLVVGWSASMLAGACGGTTVIDDTSTSSSSSSGAVTSSSASGMSSSSGGSGCGEGCPGESYCATFPNSCDSPGQCTPKPEGCEDDCPGVCGCDGQFYCNACGAQSAGVDVNPDFIGCMPSNVTYKAEAFFGGLDHIFIQRADYDNDTCITLHLAWPQMNQPQYPVEMPSEWGVADVFAAEGAADCFLGGGGLALLADGAQGVVDWKVEPNMYFPCELSLSVTVDFSSPFPGLNNNELLQAQSLIVDGGCM